MKFYYIWQSSAFQVKNKDFFAPYMTEDFDKYVARKRKWNVHGNHLEIQAMSEMYNRTIEVYCYEIGNWELSEIKHMLLCVCFQNPSTSSTDPGLTPTNPSDYPTIACVITIP